MSGQHFPLEYADIKGFWLTADLAFDQCGADGLDLGATFLFAPDKVANMSISVQI